MSRIDWGRQAATIRDGLEASAEEIEYTPRGAAMFPVRGTPCRPGSRDITAGIEASAQKIAFSPMVFLAASGGVKPRKGDVAKFGGHRYAIESVIIVRRGGFELRYNCFAAG